MMNDEFCIETPEAVSLGYAVAGIGSRFMAALVDSLLIALIQVVVVGITWGVVSATAGDLGPWLIAGLSLLAFALLWGYYILFEMFWNGQSPGKRWVGLRVIKDTGAPISLVDSVIRNLVRLVDFLPAYYGVGLIVMFLNARARRLGDLAAGTLVVRERKDVTLDSLLATPYLVQDAASAGLDLAGLTAEDYDLIVRFLQRRYELANRPQLAVKLAATFSARLGLPPQELSPPAAEQLLSQIATAYRLRGRRTDQPP